MKEITVNIEGKEFIIDLEKAKELGVLKEDKTIKDFQVGDVFLLASGSKVIIVQNGYNNIYSDTEQRYNFAGLGYSLNLYSSSSFGKEGGTKEEVLAYLNNGNFFSERPAKFLKNINKDVEKLLVKLN
jgi:hypothetical protein